MTSVVTKVEKKSRDLPKQYDLNRQQSEYSNSRSASNSPSTDSRCSDYRRKSPCAAYDDRNNKHSRSSREQSRTRPNDREKSRQERSPVRRPYDDTPMTNGRGRPTAKYSKGRDFDDSPHGSNGRHSDRGGYSNKAPDVNDLPGFVPGLFASFDLNVFKQEKKQRLRPKKQPKREKIVATPVAVEPDVEIQRLQPPKESFVKEPRNASKFAGNSDDEDNFSSLLKSLKDKKKEEAAASNHAPAKNSSVTVTATSGQSSRKRTVTVNDDNEKTETKKAKISSLTTELPLPTKGSTSLAPKSLLPTKDNDKKLPAIYSEKLAKSSEPESKKIVAPVGSKEKNSDGEIDDVEDGEILSDDD